jgi:CRP-like cAMP-binding protein
MLRKIEFLKDGISPHILNKLIYTIPSKQYDPGQLIFKPGDIMNTIQMVEEGLVEIYIYFEGVRFVIERLYPGSVINYRNLFLDDEPTQVYAQCLK